MALELNEGAVNLLNAYKEDLKKGNVLSATEVAFNPYGKEQSSQDLVTGLLEEPTTETPSITPPEPIKVEPVNLMEDKGEKVKSEAPPLKPEKAEAVTATPVTKVEPTEPITAYGPSTKMEDYKNLEDYLKNAPSETALVMGQLFEDIKKIDPDMAKKMEEIVKEYGSFTSYSDIKKARTEYAKTLEEYPKEMETLSKQADELRAKKPEYNWWLLAAAALIGGRGGTAFVTAYQKAVVENFNSTREREAEVLSDKMKALEYKVKIKQDLLKLTTDQMKDDISMITTLGNQYLRAKNALLLSKTNAISEVFVQENKRGVEGLHLYTDKELKNIFATKYGVTEGQMPIILEAYYEFREKHNQVEHIASEIGGRRALARNKEMVLFNQKVQLDTRAKEIKMVEEMNKRIQNGNITGGLDTSEIVTVLNNKELAPDSGMESLLKVNQAFTNFKSKYGAEGMSVLGKLVDKVGDRLTSITDFTPIITQIMGKTAEDISVTAGGREGSGVSRSLNNTKAAQISAGIQSILTAVSQDASLKIPDVASVLKANLQTHSDSIYTTLSSNGLLPKAVGLEEKAVYGNLLVNYISKSQVSNLNDLLVISTFLGKPETWKKINIEAAKGTTAIERAKLSFQAADKAVAQLQENPDLQKQLLDEASVILKGSGNKGVLTKVDAGTELINHFAKLRAWASVGRSVAVSTYAPKSVYGLQPELGPEAVQFMQYAYIYGLDRALAGTPYALPLSSYMTNPSY